MYLNYYAAEVNEPGDNPPIGIILNITDRLALDTLLDTLEKGRPSFLEISTFPEMLIYSTPTISSTKSDRLMAGLFSHKSSQ